MQRARGTPRLGVFGLGLTLVLAAAVTATGAQTPQLPLAANAIPQFAQPLPLLGNAALGLPGTMPLELGNKPLTITMCEFDAEVLPPGTFQPGVQPTTRVFGYVLGDVCPTTPQDTYIGPVLLNQRNGGSTDVTFVNNLGNSSTTGVLAWKYSSDQTLHWADPLGLEANDCNNGAMAGSISTPGTRCAENYLGPIPAVPHLHGGEVPPELDGGPDAWFTSDGAHKGHGYYSFTGAAANAATYKYPNVQEASPIWFHDHLLGGTRLNVYAGLAGAYLIADPALALPPGLHAAGLSYTPGKALPDVPTVPVVIQDRMFDTNGQLFFQADSAGGLLWATNPEHPYWSPEFVGDTIVVNGKAWPYLDVEPKRYRLWFINGSNARTYEMFLIDPLGVATPPRLWVIATDGGYLDAPVMAKKLVMMPGERYEVIVDFSGVPPGTNLVLKNTAKTPYPAGAAPQGATLGQIMQFRVGTCASGFCGAADASYNPASGGALRPAMTRLVDPAKGTLAVAAQKTRQLTLNEVMGMPVTALDPVTNIITAYPGGPLEILVNNTKWSGASTRAYDDFTTITVAGIATSLSELPQEGDTEVWEVVNLTADAHPIHLHLVQFQLMNRQNFDLRAYDAAYQAAFPPVPGDPMCAVGGVFCPGFGPPLNYNTGNARALGGNPDIAAPGPNGKPLYLMGTPQPPEPQEAGWKDTVVMYPGQVTRIAVRWAPTHLAANAPAASRYFPFDPSSGFNPLTPEVNALSTYVWHCHIIDHEDNEMMRPDIVTLNPAAPAPIGRTLVKGVAY